MADFDFDNYIKQRFGTPGTDKIDAVVKATQAKVAALQEYQPTAAQLHAQRLATEEAQRNSWAGTLGLDPEGVVGGAVNAAQSGTSRLVGTALAAAPNLLASSNQAKLSEEDIAALGRFEQGVATDEDLVRINRPIASDGAMFLLGTDAAQQRADNDPNALTPLSIFREMNSKREVARNVADAFDRSAVANSKTRQAFEQQLASGFEENWKKVTEGGLGEAATGLANLVLNAGEAALTNPQAASQYIIENAPQLLVGAMGPGGRAVMSMSNVGYAQDTYSKGIQDYQTKNGGALPPPEQRQKMAMYAASLALAEQVGDVAALGFMKPAGKAAQVAQAASVKKAALGVIGATVEGAVTEGVTEGYQTFAEGEVTGKPASAQDIYMGATIGAVAGGGLSGGGRAVAEVTGSTPEAAERKALEATRSAAQKAAIASGDVAPLLDPESTLYSPARAVAALTGNSLQEGATPEQREANRIKVAEINGQLLAQAEALQAELEAATEPKEQERIKGQIARLDRVQEEADAAVTKFIESVLTKPQKVEEAARDPEQSETLVNLAMADPGSLDPQQALQLANDTGNALSEDQRSFLRQFSEARIEENKLRNDEGVNQEILHGSGPKAQLQHKGIDQYRKAMGKALYLGDRQAAERELEGLKSFERDQAAKAAALMQAQALHKKNGGRPVQVLRNTEVGGWELNRGKLLSKAEMDQNGGITIHMNTPTTLVPNIRKGAQALTAAVKELDAAYALKFSNKGTQGNGSNQPQHEGRRQQQDQATDQGVQAPQAVGGPEAVQAAGVPGAGSAGPVEASGVVASSPAPAAAPGATTPTASAPAPGGRQDGDKDVVQSAPQANQSPSNRTPLITNKGKEMREGEARLETGSQTSTEASLPGSKEQSPAESGSVEESNAEEGVLAALRAEVQENLPYQEQNLIASGFTQVGSREEDSSARPLVAVQNFLSKVKSGEVKLVDFLKDKKLSDQQKTAFKTFYQAAKSWAPVIKANLTKRNAAFRYEDFTQFLLIDTESGIDLEENVKTAISYAGFSWVAENAMKPMENDKEEINAILLRDEETVPSRLEEQHLKYAGTRVGLVVNALGQRAVQALGLKLKKDISPSEMAKLQAALGLQALKLLYDEKIIRVQPVAGETMAMLMGERKGKDTREEAAYYFIQMARDKKRQLSPAALSIVEGVRGSKSMLDKLFSVEPGLSYPTFEPVAFDQKTTRNTDMGIPAKLAEAVDKANKEANFVREDMWRFLQLADTEIMAEIAGAEHTDGKHLTSQDGLAAANEQVQRDLDRFKEFVGDITNKLSETAIYFQHTVWKQQRVGIANNAINPQTSKAQRHMLYRKSWDSKVEFSDAAQMDNFYLRVGEGLGIKTDKQANAKSLDLSNQDPKTGIHAKIALPAVQDAVQALARMLEGDGKTMPLEDQQAVLAGVKAGGENMHSLDALMALAHMQVAMDAGQKSFQTRLMGEVDGVTNGPMLTHLLLGAAGSVKDLFKLLNRGGFFEAGNAHSQYNVWRGSVDADGKQHLDLYETTTKAMMTMVRQMVGSAIDGDLLASVYKFTGTLEDNGTITKDGRNIIKTPLTAMVFGSSVSKAEDGMAEKFIDGIYARIEDTAAGKQGAMERSELIDHLNKLLGKSLAIDTETTLEQLMKLDFADRGGKRHLALKQAFKETLGKALKVTMEQEFAAFIAQRKQLNLTAQTTFALFNSVYQGLREELIEQLVQDGELAVGKDSAGNRVLLQGLSPAHEAQLAKRLRKVQPLMHTLMSQDSGSLRTGLRIAKNKRRLSTNWSHRSNARFNQPFEGLMVVRKTGPQEQKSMSARGFELVESDPGVAMAPMSVHSTDSAISHYAALLGEVLNVHDAHGAGLATFEQTAKNLNQETWNAMLNYSPAREMHNAFLRTVHGLTGLLQDGDLPASVKANLWTELDKLAEKVNRDYPKDSPLVSADTVLEHVLKSTHDMALQADSIKLEAMAQMKSVDQYALEGGAYRVTAEDRAEAAARRAKLPEAVDPKDVESVQMIMKALGKQSTQEATAQPEQEAAPDDEADTMVMAQPTLAPGVIGASVLESVVQDLGNTPELESLVQEVKAGRPVNLVLNELASELMRSKLIQAVRTKVAAIPRGLMTAWGEVGTPNLPSEDSLVEFFQTKPQATAKEVLALLKVRIANGPRTQNSEFQYMLLAMVSKIVDQDLPVHFVTPDTPVDAVLEKGATNSRGWYVAKTDGREAIYLLSPQFRHASLTPETLLHELTHAALAKTIAAKDNPPEVRALIDDLKSLQAKAKEYAAGQKIAQQFAAALDDVQEFVAWGMSNQEFQDKVLKQISMQSKTRKNELVTGLKTFISKLVGILFRGSDASRQAIAVNGMNILVGNVSGLFAAAAKTRSQVDLVLNQAAPMDAIQSYSTVDIHNGLADDVNTLSPAFNEHVRGLLTSIVEKLHGPFGSLKEAAMKDQAISPMDVWIKALATGQMPFTSKVLASPLAVNRQEAFTIEQVEITVKEALTDTASSTVVYRQLSELFKEAREAIRPQDFHQGNWDQATPTEKQRAQDQWDFVFRLSKDNGDRSDYLARFAALGLGHEVFHTLLKRPSKVKIRGWMDGKTLGEKVQIVFDNILSLFNNLVARTRDGQAMDAKLQVLVGKLVDIEAKRRYTLARKAEANDFMAPLERMAYDAVEGARKKVVEAAGSDFVRKHSSAFVRAPAALLRVVAANKADQFMAIIGRMYDKEVKGRQGLVASTVNYVRGPMERFQELLRAAKRHEGNRKDAITAASKAILSGFVNGKALSKSKAASAAVTQVFMRSGAHTLLDHFDMADLEKLVSDKAFRQQQIDRFEALLTGPHQHFYKLQANALGFFKATDQAVVEHLLLNAHNIARLLGTVQQAEVSEEQAAAAEKTIEALVALRAIDYSDSQHLVNARDVLRDENARTDDGNGVKFTLELHKLMEQQSLERLFGGNRTLMVHGYTPEIYSPHVGVQAANADQGRELEMQGYVKGSVLPVDPADPDAETKHLYVLKDGGLQPWLSGMLSLTSMETKGSKLHSGMLNTNVSYGVDNAALQAAVARKKDAAIARMFNPSVRTDLSNEKGTFMVPVFNETGQVVNYRYMMRADTKDNLLERDNRFDKVMGVLAGSIYDKEHTPAQNRKAIEALKEVFDTQKADTPEAFVDVSPRSSDPQMRELWRLLPKATQADIRAVWGREGMWVRSDSLNIVFGYRKMSMASMFHQANEERRQRVSMGQAAGPVSSLETINVPQKLLVHAVESVLTLSARIQGMKGQDAENYARRASVKVTKAERMWQELVKEAKDIIVVKSGVVLAGNIFSNWTLLTLQGVSQRDILKHHQVAMRAATAYHSDSTELEQLRLQKATGYTLGNADEIEQRIVELEDALARNPVKELIDAGLMPTIVEDVAAEEDIYSYKSLLTRKIEGVTRNVNPKVMDAAKVVYMSKETRLYQALSRTTQLSDFVARYTLYQHLISRKNDPLSKKEAIQQASDSFVNYDIPMPRGLQYSDDMGLTYFTKYFLAIQRVLLRLSHENPLRVMMTVLLGQFMDLGPIVLEGSAIGRIPGNPIESGAFKFFGSLDELATVAAPMSLFK